MFSKKIRDKLTNVYFNKQFECFSKILKDLKTIADEMNSCERLFVVASHGYADYEAGDSLIIYTDKDKEYSLNDNHLSDIDFLSVPFYRMFNEDTVKILMEEIGIENYDFEEEYWDD